MNPIVYHSSISTVQQAFMQGKLLPVIIVLGRHMDDTDQLKCVL